MDRNHDKINTRELDSFFKTMCPLPEMIRRVYFENIKNHLINTLKYELTSCYGESAWAIYSTLIGNLYKFYYDRDLVKAYKRINPNKSILSNDNIELLSEGTYEEFLQLFKLNYKG